MKLMRFILPAIGSALLFSTFAFAQPPQQSATPASAANPLAPGQKLINEGKLDDALAFYKNALQAHPTAWDAYLGALSEMTPGIRLFFLTWDPPTRTMG